MVEESNVDADVASAACRSEIRAAQQRLRKSAGGYEVVHESAGLEVGVYVLVAPEPDRQQPHEDDELYGCPERLVTSKSWNTPETTAPPSPSTCSRIASPQPSGP